MPAKRTTKNGGRPSKHSDEMPDQAKMLAEKGWTDAEIAKFFKVTEQTVNNWKLAHPQFFESLKEGKAVADDQVQRSLFERATGYSHREDKIFCHEGCPVVVPTVKFYPPDTTAAIFWLKNRRPDEWREKQEVAHDGKIEVAIIKKW